MDLRLLQDGFFGLLISWISGMVIYPYFIDWQRTRSLGQKIKKEGPNLHLHKENTPSMGGVVIVWIVVLTVLLWYGRFDLDLTIWSTLGFFTFIGWYDDFFKSFLGKPWGMKARYKFAAQLALSCLVMTWGITIVPAELHLPFTQVTMVLSRPLLFLYGVFVLLAMSNAFNITDGLDGLAGGCGLLSFLFWGGYYLVSGDPGIGILCLSVGGALLAFLWFNAWPAKIFMGDSGSLGLGALLGLIALFSGQSLVLLLCGLIFVVETISVIIQVFSFKFFQKRVFLMSPLHHHFELRGWKEHQVTLRFWMIHALGVVIAVLGLRR